MGNQLLMFILSFGKVAMMKSWKHLKILSAQWDTGISLLREVRTMTKGLWDAGRSLLVDLAEDWVASRTVEYNVAYGEHGAGWPSRISKMDYIFSSLRLSRNERYTSGMDSPSNFALTWHRTGATASQDDETSWESWNVNSRATFRADWAA